MRRFIVRTSLLASALGLAGMPLAYAHGVSNESIVPMPLVTSAAAGNIVIAPGMTVTQAQTVGGTDHLTVEAGGALSVSDDNAVKWNRPSTALVIDNKGVIESTEDGGRAIFGNDSVTAPRTITLTNHAGALIQSQGDAVRIKHDVTGGTVTVNNAGTIHSVDGQAIDFDDIKSAGTASVKVMINNTATGVIKANDSDAIHPGQGAVVTNAGLIYSSGAPDVHNDGVDWQDQSGTLVNLDGGVISGNHHGIDTDADVHVTNAAGGTIIGRNGSGVGSDGAGTVINHGTITGAYVGTGPGDGDGVDTDDEGHVENWGLIQGTGAFGYDSRGGLNSAEGITITGSHSSVVNHAGGTIFGADRGITYVGMDMSIINDGVIKGMRTGGLYGGILVFGGVIITNTGSISSPGYAINLNGTTDSTVINAGTISGGTYAIKMDDGDDTLIIKHGSIIHGRVDGGAGHDTLFLDDGAQFDTASGFEALQIDGAAVLTGDNTIADVHVASNGRLQLGDGGTMGVVDGHYVVDGVLAVDRSDTLTLDTPISGSGGVEQAGSGTTILNAANTYTGQTRVATGTLVVGDATHVNASVAGRVRVAKGAVLAGNGRIGGLILGGTLRPGTANPIRTISGDATFQKGSTLVVGSSDNSRAGTVNVTGNAAIEGGTVDVSALHESHWSPADSYTVLQADGGVDGSFGAISDGGNNVSAFLAPTLLYAADSVSYALQRNDLAFDAVANTPNGKAAASAIEAMGTASPLYDKVALLSAADAGQSFEALSGQVHASSRAALFDDASHVRDAINRHLLGTDTGASTADGGSVWTSAWGHRSTYDGDGNAAKLVDNGGGVLVGGDVHLTDGNRLGAVVGAGHDALHLNAVDSSASVRNTYVGLYADNGATQGVNLRGGLAYSLQKIGTRREVTVGDTEALAADYRAHTLQGYVEGGYRFSFSSWSLEPFVNLAAVRISTDGFQEHGGGNALLARGQGRSVRYSTIGLHGKLTLGHDGWLSGYADAGFRRAWNTDATREMVQFVAGGGAFTVDGVPVSSNAAVFDAGVSMHLGARTRLDFGFRGQFASHMRDQSAYLNLEIPF